MKRPLLFQFCFILFFFGFQYNAFSQAYLKVIQNTSYKEGEKLFYDLRFGIIHGGEASLILESDTFNGKNVFHAVMFGRTLGIWDKLFKVRDQYESYFDKATNMPYLAIADVREGSYKRLFEYRYNHADYSLVSKRKGFFKVPSYIMDMVSVFYYMRRLDYTNTPPGEIRKYQTFFEDELFPFDVKFKGREVIQTKFGKIACLMFVPVVSQGRIFKTKEDMRFWFTDDQNRIPIRMEFDMLVGSLVAELRDYQGVMVPLKPQ